MVRINITKESSNKFKKSLIGSIIITLAIVGLSFIILVILGSI